MVDFVKIKDNRNAEALFYYEHNWKMNREIALQNNYIISYKLLEMSQDSVSDFDLMMITEYADSTQFSLAEDRFQKIIKEIHPNGPELMNEIKPKEFREVVRTRVGRCLISEN